MPARLRSDVLVAGVRRAAEAQGLIATVVTKGHEEGGLVFIKWLEGRRGILFTERAIGDERRWVRQNDDPQAEDELDARLANEAEFDPDLWVLEIMGSLDAAERILSPESQSQL